MIGGAITTQRTVLVAFASTLAVSSALAHHGFGGRYDRAQPIALTGAIETAYFGYPHAEVVLRVDPVMSSEALDKVPPEFADGLSDWREELGDTLEIEFPPVPRFFALDGRVAPGDRVAVVVLRNCEPPHELRGQWIAPANGNAVMREGQMQTEVDGC